MFPDQTPGWTERNSQINGGGTLHLRPPCGGFLEHPRMAEDMGGHLTEHIPNTPRSLSEDEWLAPYGEVLAQRRRHLLAIAERCCGGLHGLVEYACGHEYFGLHRTRDGWVFREWAPNACGLTLLGDFSGWGERSAFRLGSVPGSPGHWEIQLPPDALCHGMHYRVRVAWKGGWGDRIPSHARRVVQDPRTDLFSAQVWAPDVPYRWRHPSPRPCPPLVYEAHVGMALEEARVGTYAEFTERILPRIARAGYNTIQLMAIMEHPYYASFGYHVSSFFAASSRFGTPEDLKCLVDTAHGLGLRVIMDLVHSHAVRNELDGLARFDGTSCQFFHAGERGYHGAWDSACFDYGKPEVLHFLLSNCRFWLDEYHLDGFRFDGVTSMIYLDHGLGRSFVSYDDYFDGAVDGDALAYLGMANALIHRLRPDAITIAEDVSGMPGLAAPLAQGGIGFDFRLAMGVSDFWFKQLDLPDEEWGMGVMWQALTDKREDERTISYVESHDQAIVGGQTAMFRMVQDAMYHAMHTESEDLTIDRGVALHKLLRLATFAAAGDGYLTFMGNEFGHPEWVDFPREGNEWSFRRARRLWSLAADEGLRFAGLGRWDRAMVGLAVSHGLFSARPRLLCADEVKKILAIERNGLFFLFNFHAEQSHPDCPIEVREGTYRLLLDSDAAEFGGHGRVASGQSYTTFVRRDVRIVRHLLHTYLPCRSALVLERIHSPICSA